MKKTLTIFNFILFFNLLCTSGLLIAEERVYLDISADARKINFAVPWFNTQTATNTASEAGQELSDILAKALQFHGVIDVIPAQTYRGSQNADWKQLGVDFTVLGVFNLTANTLKIEMRLFDVTSDTMIFGKSYSGNLGQKEEMIYKFCDSVIKELTGMQGLASSQIAFVSLQDKRKELFISDILGKNLRQVTRHKNLVVSPRFLPDGKFITYTSYHTGNQNLYITDLRQNKTTQVLSRRTGMNLAPAWAPDGQTMILTLSYQGNPDLYILNKNGQILKQITKGNGLNVSASHSPDGTKIVFVSDRAGKPQVYLMDLQSYNVQRLTFEGSENAEPSWHPSEDLIVYSSLRNGVYQIFTMKPEAGAKPKQLTNALSHHESPSWSPDGNQIIFSRQDGRESNVYAMMKNGSYQRRLFSFPGSQTYPRWSINY